MTEDKTKPDVPAESAPPQQRPLKSDAENERDMASLRAAWRRGLIPPRINYDGTTTEVHDG